LRGARTLFYKPSPGTRVATDGNRDSKPSKPQVAQATPAIAQKGPKARSKDDEAGFPRPAPQWAFLLATGGFLVSNHVSNED